MSGGIAPASRITLWLTSLKARLERAPAAISATFKLGEDSSLTRGWIPPISRISSWLVSWVAILPRIDAAVSCNTTFGWLHSPMTNGTPCAFRMRSLQRSSTARFARTEALLSTARASLDLSTCTICCTPSISRIAVLSGTVSGSFAKRITALSFTTSGRVANSNETMPVTAPAALTASPPSGNWSQRLISSATEARSSVTGEAFEQILRT
mmetsp:Transcript_41356/g.67081  ORF Transcript_41356/g.67081 Transcript_41356/m.67081 type:complete len:211 (-) Transcript_41356:721-1353(-)